MFCTCRRTDGKFSNACSSGADGPAGADRGANVWEHTSAMSQRSLGSPVDERVRFRHGKGANTEAPGSSKQESAMALVEPGVPPRRQGICLGVIQALSPHGPRWDCGVRQCLNLGQDVHRRRRGDPIFIREALGKTCRARASALVFLRARGAFPILGRRFAA